MLSRNNIRIKVLQTLYAQSVKEDNTAVAERNFLKAVQESYRLYLLSVHYITQIAFFSRKDLEIKSNKFVPTALDKKASRKLYENPVIAAIRENEAFQKLIKKEGILQMVDQDTVRRLFKKFTAEEYYESYREMENTPIREHQYALVRLYMCMREDEVFMEQMTDYFPTWPDDESLIYGAIKRSLRALPDNKEFFLSQKPNPEFVEDLGKELLYLVLRKEEQLTELIASRLNNWQEDRVAVIDMTLMKMGLCEFLYFPSIPTKVTINEYVNLAKTYSTDKSKRFINGILDRLMQELQKEGRINKEGRGLLDK